MPNKNLIPVEKKYKTLSLSQDGQNSVTTVEYKTKIDAKFCKGFDKHGHVFDYLLEKKST